MAASSKLHLCLVGVGRIGRIHLAHLTELTGHVAVCDTRADILEEVTTGFGFPAYTDLDEMLDREKPAGVVIATPAASHPGLIVQAATRGVHIFCEKPLALTRREATQAARAVTSQGILFQIGFQRRFDRAYREAHDKIRAGLIGEPITFKAVARDTWRPNLDFARREVSGGLLLDMAIHDFDLARWMMGSEVRCVSAMGSSLLYPDLATVGDIDSAVVNLSFETGAVGNIEASRTGTYGYDIRTEIVGTRGALLVGQAQDKTLVAAGRDGLLRSSSTGFEERFIDSYKVELQEFIKCIQEERQPECGLKDALLSLEIALAATESLRTRTPVTVPTSLDFQTPV